MKNAIYIEKTKIITETENYPEKLKDNDNNQ